MREVYKIDSQYNKYLLTISNYNIKLLTLNKCKKCGKSFYINIKRNINFCPKCFLWKKRIKKYNYIYEFNYKPMPIFINTKGYKNPLYLGLELEVFASRSEGLNAYLLNKILKRLNLKTIYYLKHDGSIKNFDLNKEVYSIIWNKFDTNTADEITSKIIPTGIEIVSHPFTLYDIENLKLNKLCEQLYKYNFMDCFDNQGLHVHLTSKRKNKKQIVNMYYILYNEYDNKLIKSLMRRNFNRWCKIKEPYEIRENFRWHSSNKYLAVNYRNKDTIEFRFFKASINPLIIKSVLEFSHAFFYYTLKNNTLEKFKQYILKRKKKYPNLIKYYKEKNII